MANHKTFEQRHLRSLDKASADQPAREEREFFWRPEDVARYLHLSTVGAIRSWLAQGLITDADGWVKIGEMDRFLTRVVKARVEAGLFGKGLDREGKPAQLGGSCFISPNIARSACAHGCELQRLRRARLPRRSHQTWRQ
jgi:hypothetical protein